MTSVKRSAKHPLKHLVKRTAKRAKKSKNAKSAGATCFAVSLFGQKEAELLEFTKGLALRDLVSLTCATSTAMYLKFHEITQHLRLPEHATRKTTGVTKRKYTRKDA